MIASRSEPLPALCRFVTVNVLSSSRASKNSSRGSARFLGVCCRNRKSLTERSGLKRLSPSTSIVDHRFSRAGRTGDSRRSPHGPLGQKSKRGNRTRTEILSRTAKHLEFSSRIDRDRVASLSSVSPRRIAATDRFSAVFDQLQLRAHRPPPSSEPSRVRRTFSHAGACGCG